MVATRWTKASGTAPGSAKGARLSSPVHIGRQAELGLLLKAAGHPPSLVVVEGEAGVGKSRLVRELLNHPGLAGRRRLTGFCQAVREPFPFGAFVAALRTADDLPGPATLPPLVGALRPLLPERADQLPPLPQLPRDPRTLRHVLFRALRDLLASLGPAVCVLEDLHWSDEGTLELLSLLVADPPAHLSLVVTYRREDLPAASPLLGIAGRVAPPMSFARVELSPLSVEEVGRLAAALLEVDEASPGWAAMVHTLTSGIPFAVEEVVRLLADRRGWERWPGLGSDRVVPVAVRDAVLQRVGRLRPVGRSVVDAAAVIGTATDEALLAEVSGLTTTEVTDGLCDALEEAVLFSEGVRRYGFRHALAAQAVYDALPRPERRRLHCRVARALQGEGQPAARLAHHYWEAGRLREWADCAEAAADQAATAGDDAGAADLLLRVLSERVVSSPVDRGRLAVKLGRASLYGLRHQDGAVAILSAVVDEPVADEVRGELRALLGRLLVSLGDAAEGYRQQAAAIEDLGSRPDVAARVMAELGLPWVVEGHEREHRGWLDRAVSTGTEGGRGGPSPQLMLSRAAGLLAVGDRSGWAALDGIPPNPAASDDSRELVCGLLDLVGPVFHLGYYDRARALLDRAERTARELGFYLPFLGALETADLLLRWATGDWHELEGRVRRHSETTVELPRYCVPADFLLGSLALAGGRLDEAEKLLGTCQAAARSAGFVSGVVASAGGLARIRLAQGDAGAAWVEARRGVEVLEEKGIWVWGLDVVPVAVEALLGAGLVTDAEDLVRHFATGLRRRDVPAARGGLALCRGLLAQAAGHHLSAARCFAGAEQRLAALPRPYEAAMACARSGDCLLAAGDPKGRDCLREALEDLEQLGAANDAGGVRQRLRHHGLRVPSTHRGGRKGYGKQLSPQERRVAWQASLGKTNAEIANDVHLAPKTVEHHLARAMRKLGVTSRVGLVRACLEDPDATGGDFGASEAADRSATQ